MTRFSCLLAVFVFVGAVIVGPLHCLRDLGVHPDRVGLMRASGNTKAKGVDRQIWFH